MRSTLTLSAEPSWRWASRGWRPRSKWWLILAAGLLLAGLVASLLSCSGNPSWPMMGSGMMGMMGPAPTAPAGTSVTMAGSRFAPLTLSVTVGQLVSWFNDDIQPHTVTAVDRSWDSGNLAPGGTYQRRFDAAGTYSYTCLYHPWMTGTIVVAGQ